MNCMVRTKVAFLFCEKGTMLLDFAPIFCAHLVLKTNISQSKPNGDKLQQLPLAAELHLRSLHASTYVLIFYTLWREARAEA